MGRVSSGVLIGRAAELRALTHTLDVVAAARPSAVVITGEAGIGKSRLLREFGELAQEHGAANVAGGCIPLSEGALPYAPIITALRQAIRGLSDERMSALPPRMRADLARLLPELRGPEYEQPAVDDQSTLFDAVLTLLRALADERPVVWVLEDVHWSDASTRDLVTYLLNVVSDERVLFLCSLRTGELDPAHPVALWVQNLVASRMADVVELPPLTRDETSRQMSEITGTGAPDSMVAEVFERSEGNPFFVEELLQAPGSSSGDLPPSLRELLLGRIRVLDPAAIEVVKAVAVDGPVVPHDLLVAALRIDDSDVTPLIESAIDRHLLVRTDDGYAFRHALQRETVYDRILPGERRTLHRSFAEALERRAGGPRVATPSGRLARHWDEAGDPDRALPYALAAAADAEHSYASSEALQHYEQALRVWDEVAHPEQFTATGKVELYERAAAAAERTAQAEYAVSLYREALRLVDLETEPQRAAGLRIHLASVLWTLMDDVAALPLIQEAHGLVEALPATPEKVSVLSYAAATLSMAGKAREGLALAEEAMDVADEVTDEEAKSNAHSALALAYALSGDPHTAIGHFTKALDLARRRGESALVGRTCVNLSDALFQVGRAEDAVAFAKRAIEELAALGDDSFEGFLRANAAEFLIALGRWAEAESLVAALDESPALLDRAFSGWLLTGIDVERGRFEQARARAMTLERYMAHSRDPQHQDAVAMVMVSLALWEQRYDDASNRLHRVWLTEDRDPRTVARLCALGVRVEADRAARARAARSQATEREAVQRGSAMEHRCATVAAALVPEVQALQQLTAAEASRLRGSTEPVLWDSAVRGFEQLDYRYQATYARYRHGEALLEHGDRSAAATVLSEASRDAGEMGAVPLGLMIQGLARRARLKLTSAAEPIAEPAAVAPRAGDRLGLTNREMEVLRRLSEGLTNKQIAEVLFISPKTASIHVSSILAKLGVSSRTEAARWAYDSGVLERAQASDTRSRAAADGRS